MKNTKKTHKPISADFFDRLREESWTYIKTVVDVVQEPIIILDKDLQVMAANNSFYLTFKVEAKDTEKRAVYELGHGQWNIPDLRKLLEGILPHNNFFKCFEVDHIFPFIGRKVLILNGRQINFHNDTTSKPPPSLILLVMEDITEVMVIAETFTNNTNQLEKTLAQRAHKLEAHIAELEKQIRDLKKSRKDWDTP